MIRWNGGREGGQPSQGVNEGTSNIGGDRMVVGRNGDPRYDPWQFFTSFHEYVVPRAHVTIVYQVSDILTFIRSGEAAFALITLSITLAFIILVPTLGLKQICLTLGAISSFSVVVILKPCSSVDFKVQCFVPEGLLKRDSSKLVEFCNQNLNYNYRKDCSDSSQSVKDIRLFWKLGKPDLSASKFIGKDNGVGTIERNAKQNNGVLGIGEFRLDQGTGFTLQGAGVSSWGIITSSVEGRHSKENNISGIEHSKVPDQGRQEPDSSISERARLPPWGTGEVSQYNYGDSKIKLHGSVPTTLNACGKNETHKDNSCSHGNGEEASLSKILLNLSRANRVSSALRVYRGMETSGRKPTLHACNSLIAAFLRKGAIDDALSIFESMKKMIKPSEHTYSLVIKAVAHYQGWESALCILKEMETQDNLRLDIIAYNTLISVCGRARKWGMVHQLWRKLHQDGCKETMVTYRLLVSTFVQCDQVELALEAYHDMIKNGWQPNEDVLKGLTCVCAKEGHWMLALDFFQQMVDLGLKPNKITYNTLIISLGKVGEVDLAFKLYKHMQTVGHSADAYTLHALLTGLNKTAQFERSLSLFEFMKTSSNLEMDTEVYNVALVSCQRLGLWEKALQYVWGMEKSGIVPGTLTYNLLISTCEVARQPKVALQVYEHMLSINCTPNTFTYLPLFRACGRGLLWCEVKQILNVSSYNFKLTSM
eukprot:Gb_20435 [translate_table: standard]